MKSIIEIEVRTRREKVAVCTGFAEGFSRELQGTCEKETSVGAHGSAGDITEDFSQVGLKRDLKDWFQGETPTGEKTRWDGVLVVATNFVGNVYATGPCGVSTAEFRTQCSHLATDCISVVSIVSLIASLIVFWWSVIIFRYSVTVSFMDRPPLQPIEVQTIRQSCGTGR